MAYAGDVRRFSSAKALADFTGICPRQRLSDSSVKHWGHGQGKQWKGSNGVKQAATQAGQQWGQVLHCNILARFQLIEMCHCKT
ncbi:MAG: transposase [Thiobacillus sp.]|nr:transposase [Thiobacillus sp.]